MTILELLTFMFITLFFSSLGVNSGILIWTGMDARWHSELPANENTVIKVNLCS